MRCTLWAVALIIGLSIVAARHAQSQSESKQPTKSVVGPKESAPGVAVSDAPPQSATDDEADEVAIRANVEAFAKAANAHDAKGVTESFTPSGEFVDGDGDVFHGRTAIEAEFEALFKANPTGHVEITPSELRSIAPGIVVEEGTATVRSGNTLSDATVGYTMVHVKQPDGKWLIASVRSDGDDDATPHEQLEQLQWLIGDWVDESDDAVVQTSTRWSEDRNFILSDFVIQLPLRGTVRGTQRIGWDASISKFRSWVFDVEGGHAEGLWSHVDDRWIVKVTGVRPDGAIGSATTIYVPGTDSISVTSTDRVVGDEAAPDMTVTMVRKPPEPK